MTREDEEQEMMAKRETAESSDVRERGRSREHCFAARVSLSE